VADASEMQAKIKYKGSQNSLASDVSRRKARFQDALRIEGRLMSS